MKHRCRLLEYKRRPAYMWGIIHVDCRLQQLLPVRCLVSAGEYLDMSRFILPGGLQQLQEEDVSV